MLRGIVAALALVSACTGGSGSPRAVRVEVTISGDTVTLDAVSPYDDEPPGLDESGRLGVTWRDAGGAVLAQGYTLDLRRAWEERSDDETTFESSFVLVPTMSFALVLPAASGTAELTLDFETPSGRVQRSVSVPLPEPGRAVAPLVTSGAVGAQRAALADIECPTQDYYAQWPDTEEMPRESYRGCGTMAHLGGVEDPRGALLVLFYPSTGWGATNLASFRTTAEGIVGDALATNEWFRDHADRLSFYAILDERVAATGGADCTAGGLGSSARTWGEDRHLWRAKGAHYGPRERTISDNGIEPDIYVALRNDYCDGFGNEGGFYDRQSSSVSTHIVIGSQFGCQGVRGSGCPIGSRLAHEMGHALGGLADEYGKNGTCPGGAGYPNFGLPGAVPWGCHIGSTPAIECPDDDPPVRHSFLREYASSSSCTYRRPCSDSLMRGFYGSVFQFDDVGYDAMTHGLNLELGRSLPMRLGACASGTSGTCAPSCDGVDCGLDGCDGGCACSCMGTDMRVCETAVGSGVCTGTDGCGRASGLAPGICPSVTRSPTTYLVATCQAAGWTTTACTTYTSATACLTAAR